MGELVEIFLHLYMQAAITAAAPVEVSPWHLSQVPPLFLGKILHGLHLLHLIAQPVPFLHI